MLCFFQDERVLMLFVRYTSIGIIDTLTYWVMFAICIFAFHAGQDLC